jgi:dTMP kinase
VRIEPRVATREPGGTPLGERVRGVLLEPGEHSVDPWAELLLYEASRAQLLADLVRPTLEAGGVALCDRYTDSTVAYQGYGRGLPLARVELANELATGGLVPDVTVLLDVDPRVGLARATSGGADRLESEDLAFHERVRGGFRDLAAASPERFIVIDATPSVADVSAAVLDALRRHPAMAGVLN